MKDSINPSTLMDFTRGGQLTMHALRMFGQAMRYILMLSLGLWLVVFIIFVFIKTDDYERYIVSEYFQANIKLVIQDKQAEHEIKTPRGHRVKLKALNFVQHPKTQACLHHFRESAHFAFVYSCVISLIFFFSTAIWLFKKGQLRREMTALRGGGLVDASELAFLIKSNKKDSDFKLAKVPLLQGAELQHLLITGTTGTGKSVCLQELMDQIRAKGQRAIVYDIEGTFIPLYYRPDKDIILNPLDERSPAWNIWQECQDAADFEAIASSLMPSHLSGNDPFWVNSARSIFSTAALSLAKGSYSNQALLEALFSENNSRLSELLAGTVAETLISEKNEKTALSIKATLSTYCKALTYLKEDTTGPLFSIRQWVEADKDDSWLFIASNALKIDALKPLLSVWLDVAAKSILCLPQSQTRRIWFLLDELASLHRLPSLVNTLSRCRKYGGCFVSVIQDIHQLYSVYGKDEAQTLTTLFNSHLCFRTSGADSAMWMSKMMGSREIIENKEGVSYGANDIKDSVSIHQDRRRETIIMDSEFQELENLHAYLKLPGPWPIAKLIFEIKKRKSCQPAFIEREIKIAQESSSLNKIVKKEDGNKALTLQIEKTNFKSLYDKLDEIEGA